MINQNSPYKYQNPSWNLDTIHLEHSGFSVVFVYEQQILPQVSTWISVFLWWTSIFSMDFICMGNGFRLQL